MNPAEKIIAKFGGLNAMSRKMEKALGKPVPPSTIQYWGETGRVPALRQADVLATARAEKIGLGPADFFEPMEAAR